MKTNYKIIAKYIKNLKFEIPNPDVFYQLTENISNYKININIKSNQLKEKIVEVETALELKPIKDDFEKINTQIVYSTIIEIENLTDDKKILEEIILIKVPTEIYSELRSIFIFLFERSGFKKIKIDEKVDFKKLYSQRTVQ
jgi:preprotein translocase subunit SecB|tara:strand:+ start:444 stop:869 length:426 start_codon:yes stop_codon:yes gene_type:complete